MNYLIERITGKQFIFPVNDNAIFNLPNKILWNEQIDGVLDIDEIKLGGYERVNNKLVFNQQKKDQYEAKINQQNLKIEEEKNKAINRLNLIKNTGANIPDRLNALIEHLGLDV